MQRRARPTLWQRAAVAGAMSLAMTGCLLDVSYDKIDDSTFCSGEPTQVPTPPSCATGSARSECGRNYADDCCDAPALPCGSFARDYDGSSEYPDDSRGAKLSDFRLDKYEVSVARFRAFVDAGHGTQASPPAEGSGAHPKFVNSGWQTSANASLAVDSAALTDALAGVAGSSCEPERAHWTNTALANETLPINCVTWFEASAFCAWDGGRVPTEAEWNYAAAGAAEQRAYPWAEGELTHELAVFGCPASMAVCPANTAATQVGTRPEGGGRYGHLDLAGNVAEWVADRILAADNYKLPCDDCIEFAGSGDRGIRGGAYDSTPLQGGVDDLRVSYRRAADPSSRFDSVGFRCARPFRTP
jgi:formylglycine-generating enzyme required for sulfatase activity